MNIDSRNIAEAIGLISVVASLLFVGYEIRQNTIVARAQTRDSITEKTLMVTAPMVADSSVADVMIRGTAGELKPGDGTDYFRFSFQAQNAFRVFENEWYQFEQGLFDESEFRPRTLFWRNNMRLAGFQAIWSTSRTGFSPSFREFIDNMITEINTEGE